MPYQTAHGIRYFRHPDRKQRLEPLRAWRAMGKLLEDGEDTKQAFEIAAALSGKSLEKNFQRFLSEPSGPDLFIRREELVDRLSDDAWLDTMPEGSFGATYLLS